MITLLIGHRGVGKSTFLRRLDPVFTDQKGVVLKDLDAEIETVHRRTIDSIFKQMGEAEFRKLEAETFEQLYKAHRGDTKLILAVGAGFQFAIPDDVEVMWLRRPTDVNGRIFLDRPPLNEKKEQTPLQVWESRYADRDERYRRLAQQELTLPEGSLHDPILEEHIFMMKVRQLPFVLTALPENFKAVEFFERRRLWGLKAIEIRDDLLSDGQIKRLMEFWPKEKTIYSVRKSPVVKRPDVGMVDWPLELGKAPLTPEILSLHQREGTVAEAVAQFPKGTSSILKLAIPIETFGELREGHLWWKEDPKNRSFLPMSKNGRWQWYRQLFGPQMPIHFFREGDGTSWDQPYLWQTLVYLKWGRSFAAVIGSPVHHSWTPTFQREFFDDRMVPVVAIDVAENEWNEAIPVLQEMGLRYAAVTSPHKRNAYALTKGQVSDEAKMLESVNTLALTESGWVGHNTDLKGAKSLFKDEFSDNKPVLVWGGGGTKEVLKQAIPKAEFVSAREGIKLTSPIHLVWATSRARPFVWPQPAVYVQDVIDLNYTEDSPGREIALLAGAPYKSGETMFIQQGFAQREFWKRF